MKRLFEVMARAYPHAFRSRFGPEVVDQASDDCRRAFERGEAEGWLRVAGTCLDLIRSGLAERVRPVWPEVGAGGVELEKGVGMRMGQWMQDLRYAGRALAKAPGFTFSTVVTLALALGVNAGIFSFVDAVLLRPLPFGDADRLVYVAASAPGSDLTGEFPVAREFFVHYRDQATQLEDLGAFNDFTGTVRVGDRVERLRQSVSTPSLFTTMGATPVLGRLPMEGDSERTALISHGLWTTWFGADPSVIGRSYEFATGTLEVIGVMGPEFRFPSDDVVAWIPFVFTAEDIARPGRFGELGLVGRLTPEADAASLARELALLARRLPELYGGSPAYARVIEQHVPVVRSLREELVGDVSGPLWVLMASVAVVLLIACANVAGLFSVRAEGRGREFAVRRAIGAGRGDLIRSQLSEAVVVAALAGLGALVLAWIALPVFLRIAPDSIPRIGDVRMSATTGVFTFIVSGLAALACGMVPAARWSAPDLDRLKDGARGSTRRRHWGRDGLVVAQTGLALVLLVGSGLLLRSFQQLRSVDPGFDTEDILTFQFAPDEAHLVDGPSWASFHLDFLARLRALPGVERAGIVENTPLDEGLRRVGFTTDAAGADADESGPQISVTFAGGDYFQAMGIAVLEGRAFGDDDARVPGNVVVSRAAADLLWPGESALQRRLRNTVIQDWHTVVGVVEDVLQYDFRGVPEPIVYYPLVGPTPTSWALTSPGYAVRSARADALAPEIRALVKEVAPSAPLYRVHTMEALVARSMVQLSFTMLTLSIAAGLALLLGAIGLYGVLSYLVAERTQEIGVRMALGAEARRVQRMIVGQGARVVFLGILMGLGVALFAARALSGLLFGVAPFDAWTFGGMSVAMAAVGLLASYLPARRASRVDPMTSMRGG